MNIEQAKAIPLTEILNQLNIHPTSENEKEAKYISPWRHELSPSFHVNKKSNVWFDFGDWIGGDVVKFISELLKSKGEDHTPKNALAYIRKMRLEPSTFQPKDLIVAYKPAWTIVKIKAIHDVGLIRYVENRGISVQIARKHLSEIHVTNSDNNKIIRMLGFKNEDDGYELRNYFMKSCISPKTVTFIRGTDNDTTIVHFFEGVFDYLSYLTQNEDPTHPHDVFVLNSVGMVVHLEEHLNENKYKEGVLWLDTDNAGQQATKALSLFLKSKGITPTDMSPEYKDFDDLNECHMAGCKLKKLKV